MSPTHHGGANAHATRGNPSPGAQPHNSRVPSEAHEHSPRQSETKPRTLQDDDLWTVIFQIARMKLTRPKKSFEVNGHIAVVYDHLFGMVVSALRDQGLARKISDHRFITVLGQHGVNIGMVKPPANWTKSDFDVRCCLFPLSMLGTAPQSGSMDPDKVTKTPPTPALSPRPDSDTGISLPIQPSLPVILVDVSNVAHGTSRSTRNAELANVNRVFKELGRHSVRVIALADASLRHKIDDPDNLERMFKEGHMEQTPAGTSADDFIWQLWKRYRAQGVPAFILTNDQFPTKRGKEEGIPDNPRITFMVFDGEAVFQPLIGDVLSTVPWGSPPRTDGMVAGKAPTGRAPGGVGSPGQYPASPPLLGKQHLQPSGSGLSSSHSRASFPSQHSSQTSQLLSPAQQILEACHQLKAKRVALWMDGREGILVIDLLTIFPGWKEKEFVGYLRSLSCPVERKWVNGWWRMVVFPFLKP